MALHYKPLGRFAELSLAFLLQQSPLPVNTPAMPAQAPVSTDDAVTRDHNGDWIRGAGSGNRASRRRLANGRRYFAIRAGSAVWDCLQFAPNAHLKGGGPNIQRQIQLRLSAFQMLHYIVGPSAKRSIALNDVGG